jgi:glycosyltransferase involved in cell wall biosynthesis
VIATRAGGQAEIVVDGSTGFLIDKGDHVALGQQLALLLTDHHLARRLGAAGRRRAVELFDWPVVTGQLRAVYVRAMGSSHPSDPSHQGPTRLAS